MSQSGNDAFRGWQRALSENALTSEQLKVLERMVADGEASSIETAASMLDWQDSIINKDEHMYGF
jgi:hypothetical protein